ncbi:MAG: sugar ABC transporter permease [Treponema sp.]|nr:sugar ABC transporter permease [Treponema sp.]
MNNMYRKYTPFLFIAPFFILYFIFQFFPMLFSFFISFTKWSGAGLPEFVGLKNYTRLLTDRLFFKSVTNTLLLMVISIPVQMFTGLLLSILLKDFTSRSRSVFQLLNFLPYLAAPVALGFLFQLLFDWKTGTVNIALMQLGLVKDPYYWLGNVLGARFVVIFLGFWRYYGYMMVFFLTGLSTVPEELYEAAIIDGANWIQRHIKITLPMLRSIMTFVVTTSIIGSWKIFDEPRILFTASGARGPTGGPERSLLTIVLNFYDTAFQRFEFGYGTAIAFALFVIIFVFSGVSMKISDRGGEI